MATFSGGEALTKTIVINTTTGGRMNTSFFDPFYTCPAGKYATITILAFPSNNLQRLYISNTTGTNFSGTYSQLLFNEGESDSADIEAATSSQSPNFKRPQLKGSRIGSGSGTPDTSGSSTNYEYMMIAGESLGRGNTSSTMLSPFICFIREYNLIP